MDRNATSHELLAHFDRSKLAISPDFDWDENAVVAEEFCPGVVRDEVPASSLGARCARPQPPTCTRGADWVLQWAGAVLVLAIAAGVLVDFACGVRAEHALRVAARAGATEATLPKATYESVAAVIGRRLAAYPELKQSVQLTLLQNGVPVGERFMAIGGDRISVTISAPASVTRWTPSFSLHRDQPPMFVQAESRVPGRTLVE